MGICVSKKDGIWLSTGSKCTYIIQSVPHCILVCFQLQYFSKTNPKYSLLRLKSLPRKPRLHINLRNPLSRYNILFRYLKNSGLELYQVTDLCMSYYMHCRYIPMYDSILWSLSLFDCVAMQNRRCGENANFFYKFWQSLNSDRITRFNVMLNIYQYILYHRQNK